MNIVGLVYLASCLTGLVVVVPPEPLDTHQQQPSSSHDGPHHLHAAKHAAEHVSCDQPPCPPTLHDNLKDTIHHGYQQSESFEGAKDFVRDHVKAAKESAEDAYHHAKLSMHETAERVKHGMYETVEKVKDSMHDPVEKATHGVHDTVQKAKHGVQVTADSAASSTDGKDKEVSHAEPDPASYIMPGVSKTMDTLTKTFEEEKHAEPDPASYIMPGVSKTMDTLKKTFEEEKHEASGYLSSDCEDTIESVKKCVKEKVKGMQDKASHMLECASNMTQCVRDKAGNLICGIKEKLIPHARAKDDGDGLEMKVHELCSMYGVDQGKQEGKANVVDKNAVREIYGYLMESAVIAVDGAKEIFEKAIAGEGSEWKEKYMYLSESAKGALEGAKDVFERVVKTMEGNIMQRHKEANDHVRASLRGVITKKHLTSGLKQVAARTKQRLFMRMHSLLRTLYLASFSIAFGVTFWLTFCSGHVLTRILPRHQLALVQSKLFPVYLRVITGCLLVCTIGHSMLHPWLSANWWEHLQSWNFSFSLVVSLFMTFLLEPKVTKVVFEKLRIEREEGHGQSGDHTDGEALASSTSGDAKFKALHQVSSFANLVIIAGLTWHLWYLAHRLVV